MATQRVPPQDLGLSSGQPQLPLLRQTWSPWQLTGLVQVPLSQVSEVQALPSSQLLQHSAFGMHWPALSVPMGHTLRVAGSQVGSGSLQPLRQTFSAAQQVPPQQTRSLPQLMLSRSLLGTQVMPLLLQTSQALQS
jgi:hypothetical protein